jgi:ABC-type branched-subunit amino acid transport system ATPase component
MRQGASLRCSPGNNVGARSQEGPELDAECLANSGQTIVLVEQNLAAALTLAQRAYIINNGHIAHDGPTSEFKAQPKVLERYLGV